MTAVRLLHFWRMLAVGRFWGCHEWKVWGSAMWPGLVTRGGAAPASHPPSKISWPHHPNGTSLQAFLTATVKKRLLPGRKSCLAGGPGTVLSVCCLRRLTFISWWQAGTEALWPWMSGHARHEPAVPFRQPTPTRAHDTPECLCVVWATSPRTPLARRLPSGWRKGGLKKGKPLAQVGRRLCPCDGPLPPGRGPTQVGGRPSGAAS